MKNFSGTFAAPNKGYKIKTPNGWEDFAGIECTGHDPIIRIEFDTGTHLECNKEHQLFKVCNGDEHEVLPVADVSIGDVVMGTTKELTITDIIETDRIEPVYEVIHVQNTHSYYTNGVLSHNCEFVTYQETLIDPVKLREIKQNQVRRHDAETEKVRWFKQPKAGMTYLVGLDPASGTGGNDPSKSNNAAIQVYEVPSLDQVAEWYANDIGIAGQVRVLNKILRIIDTELYEQGEDDPDIFWTVENNMIGEAAIIDITNMGLENFPGTMMNEPKKTRTGKIRRGYTTSKSSKKTACFTMKKLVEQEKLEIASEALFQELNGFIAKDLQSTMFAAKDGSTDDLISALLLVIRMIGVVSTYEDDLAETVQESLEDDLRVPLPLIMTSSFR